ncbi:MAG: bifunctional folylpolyglutamate synthase/dihydrofolate synthase, partial [Proteobacteria bacterium]|nr:bifunctional folylpolyglutamate synthase/dihydrofolate synthase [Pseudomonadota bacterium]
RERGAVQKRLGVEFKRSGLRDGQWRYQGPRWDFSLPPPSLFGEIQLDNAATAIAALEELQSRLPVGREAIAAGLGRVRLPGRFQIIDPGAGEPRWILDVAHNPAAAAVLARNLQALPAAGRTLAVFGMLADKDARAVVAALNGVIDHWYLAGTEGPRGLTDAQLAERVADLIPGRFTLGGGFAQGCTLARRAALPADDRPANRIVAFGSFHCVAPALDWLESEGLKSREGFAP